MNPNLREAFDLLLDVPASEWDVVIAGMDLPAEMEARLRAMLSAHRSTDDVLSVPVITLVEQMQPDPVFFRQLAGRQVGSFTVHEMIGEGGSSAVFRARRPAGSGEQEVALKILRASKLSADAERRFRREQSILAQLSHPSVARFVEGGVDTSGLPYIAMELVRGVPLTEAAGERALDVEGRLKWVVILCEAIHAAHAALIVHCDLKPTNVLIDDSGVLKVLDFGVARLIDDSQTAEVTRTIVLTPDYAAPEQYALHSPNVAVDVYAIGVILAEVLAGSRLSREECRQASAAVAKHFGKRNSQGLPQPAVLTRQLAGDLDAIIAKATAELPEERYSSAEAMGRDIERYLSGHTIEARRGSSWTKTVKFVRRHRIGVALTFGSLLGLCSSLYIAVVQAQRASLSAAQANAQAARADTVRDLVFDIFSEAEPGGKQEGEVTVNQVIEAAVARLDDDTSTPPAIRLDLLARLAMTLARQGHVGRAEAILVRADREAQQALGRDHEVTLEIEERLSRYQGDRGNYAPARARVDDLLARTSNASPRLRVQLLETSTSLAWRMGDTARALRDGHAARDLVRTQADVDLHVEVLTYLGAMYLGVDHVDEAVAVYEELLQLARARYGEAHEKVATAFNGLARAYRRSGKLDAAETAARKALAIGRLVYPTDHWVTANQLNALVMVLVQRRDFEGALDAAREAYDITVRLFGEDESFRLSAQTNLGLSLLRVERPGEALPYLKDAVERLQRTQGEAGTESLVARMGYGYALARSGRAEEGAAELAATVAALKEKPRTNTDLLAKTLEKSTRVALLRGRSVEALALSKSLNALTDQFPDRERASWCGKSQVLAAKANLQLNRFGDALQLLEDSAREMQQRQCDDPEVLAERLVLASMTYRMLGRYADQREALHGARELLGRIPSPPKELVDAVKRQLPP